MFDDKIGTIGSTQGVTASPRPSSRNSGRITNSLPLLREASIFPISESGAACAGCAGCYACFDCKADAEADAAAGGAAADVHAVTAAGVSLAVDYVGG